MEEICLSVRISTDEIKILEKYAKKKRTKTDLVRE